MIDEWFAYKLAYGGEPEFFQEFRHGMATLYRHRAQTQLMYAEAARKAQDVTGKQYEQFHRSLSVAAGFTRTT